MSVTARALDGVYGRSAAGVRARLDRLTDNGWAPVAHAETDGEGQITEWAGAPFVRGAHRIVFDSDYYFAGLGVAAAYPEVAVAFRIRDESDTCQVQLVLAPSSYSMHLETRG
jgi:5-hydroxyisourate hydrolase